MDFENEEAAREALRAPADPAAVDAANGTVGVGCTACHAIYRQGEDGDYRLNEAALR